MSANTDICSSCNEQPCTCATQDILWKNKNWWERTLTVLGWGLTIIFCLGCGASTAATIFTLGLLSGPAAPIVAGILFTATTSANWIIFNKSVPAFLIDNVSFLRKQYLKLKNKLKGNKIEPDLNETPLSAKKKWAIGGAFILSLSVGATFAALTYSSTFTLTVAFGFLSAISAAFPPIAAVLAAATLICMTALMIRDIVKLIKKENTKEICMNYLKDLVDVGKNMRSRHSLIFLPDMDAAPTVKLLENYRNKIAFIKIKSQLYYVNAEKDQVLLIKNFRAEELPYSNDIDNLSFEDLEVICKLTTLPVPTRTRARAERILALVLTAITMPLAAFGLYMTMNTCAPGVKAFLLNSIPRASVIGVSIASQIIALGLAFVGQIPFAVQTVKQTIDKGVSSASEVFSKKTEKLKNYEHKTSKQKLIKACVIAFIGFELLLVSINAVGNGLISKVGAGSKQVLGVFALIAGFLNSWFAGASSILDANKSAAQKILIPKPDLIGSENASNNGYDNNNSPSAQQLQQRLLVDTPLQPLSSPKADKAVEDTLAYNKPSTDTNMTSAPGAFDSINIPTTSEPPYAENNISAFFNVKRKLYANGLNPAMDDDISHDIVVQTPRVTAA